VDELLKNERARARIAEIWKMRAVGEHQSTARFAAYAARMKRLGIPQEFQDQALEASADELRHRDVCLDMARRLRFGEIVLGPQEFPVPADYNRANLLADMVVFCCFTETINVILLTKALHDIREPEIAAATRILLRDEVTHSKLGWSYLAWARSRGEGDLLSQHLAHMLWDALPQHLFVDGPARPDADFLLAMGDASMPTRRALVLQAVREVVLPGLEANGIDTAGAKAWLDAPTWPSSGGTH
jgi:hypothetical protein